MQPYENEARFQEALIELFISQTEAYADIREQLLTPKFKLQDFCITLLITAGFLFLVSLSGKHISSSPFSSWILAIMAVSPPSLTIGGVVFDLLQAYERDIFSAPGRRIA